VLLLLLLLAALMRTALKQLHRHRVWRGRGGALQGVGSHRQQLACALGVSWRRCAAAYTKPSMHAFMSTGQLCVRHSKRALGTQPTRTRCLHAAALVDIYIYMYSREQTLACANTHAWHAAVVPQHRACSNSCANPTSLLHPSIHADAAAEQQLPCCKRFVLLSEPGEQEGGRGGHRGRGRLRTKGGGGRAEV